MGQLLGLGVGIRNVGKYHKTAGPGYGDTPSTALINGLSQMAVAGYNNRFFKASDGDYFAILPNNQTLNRVDAWKSTDPLSSWSNADNISTSSGRILGLSVKQESDVLHIAYTHQFTDDLYYVTFDMATESFGTPELVTNMGKNQSPIHWVSITVRGDGVPVIGYNGDSDKIQGTKYHRTYIAYKNGSWTVDLVVGDDSLKNNFQGIIVMAGSSNRIHAAYVNADLDDLRLATLDSAWTEQSDILVDGSMDNVSRTLAHGDEYSGNCMWAYRKSSSVYEAEFASADTPTVSSGQASVDNPDNTRNPSAYTSPSCELFFDDATGAKVLIYERDSDEHIIYTLDEGSGWEDEIDLGDMGVDVDSVCATVIDDELHFIFCDADNADVYYGAVS